MDDEQPSQVRIGGDPRTLADYVALRNEMNKLIHPARPDVNWQQAEKFCLSLFEQNGTELQTAAWYTLARTYLSGLSGLNEGLSLMNSLVTRHWGNLWPQQVPVRMEILATLSKRLKQALRSWPLTSADLSQLNQAREHLLVLDETLRRLELTPVSQLDTLRSHINSATVRLGNSDKIVETPVTATAEAETPASGNPSEAAECVKRAHEPEPLLEAVKGSPPPLNPWKPFAGGMATMLLLAGILAGGWLAMHQSDPAQEPVAVTLSPLPATRSVDRWLHATSETDIRQTQQQLEQLLQLKPDWALSYGDSLVQQALRLSPEEGKPLAHQWQQQKAASALAPESLTGWHQGVTQLEQLAKRLNALDEQKGKYMTVSELKSAIFAITQSLNRTVPVEEQLRQLSVTPAEQSSNAVRQRQVEQHLQQLIASYAALKQTPAE
ncbi:VasL domain-containing protein [Leclercia adecarboxylata]|uniref:VasL domain-containing protein n=1 Tax=Leclercia adecarboxylata TaxID=83655 RepID=UPI002B2912A4|nr:type VI secretion system ImpA family N-terminal domain-containing protein [Leclercia adecarboxylata]